MNTELLEALDILEKEKNISKDVMLEAIENSLLSACKNHFGTSDNIKIVMDRNTCDYSVYAEREVVEEVFDPAIEISLEDAEKINPALHIGDIAQVELHSKEFGRIATQNAKNVILQKIREEERKVLYDQYYGIEKEVVTGIVQRVMGKNVSINLGKADAVLTENEQVKGEVFKNKTGELSAGDGLGVVENDIAIVFDKEHPYVLCVLSNNIRNNSSAQETIQKISADVYQYMTSRK